MNGLPESCPLESSPAESAVPGAAPPDTIVMRHGTREFVRWVYTSNPFYAASAVLFFWGLWSSCYTKDYWAFKTATLMVGLGAYSLLLAGTTFLVVRWGKVWEDGRSLLVLTVVMFLGLSVSFDDALTGHFAMGVLCSITGLAFAVALSEVVLRGLGLRLGVRLRMPYYLMLALFFLYPVALGAMDQQHPAVPWVVFAFPATAGVVLLSLLPAIRKGPQYVRDNGSPWPWPWFPWTLFALLALAVGPRSYYLAVSMHQVGGLATIFAPYFLVLLLFAVGVLLLEMGLVAQSPLVLRIALLAPLGALVLAGIACADEETALEFLDDFRATLGGTPLFFTLVLSAGFYAWAALRRVAEGIDALTFALLALASVAPQTYGCDTLGPARAMPVLFVAVAQAMAARRHASSQRCFLSACCVLAAATIAWQDTWFAGWQDFLPRHLVLGVMFLMSFAFRGRLANFLEYFAAVALLTYGSTAALGSSLAIGDVPAIVSRTYPAFAIAAALILARLLGNRLYYALAATTAVCWGFGRGGSLYARLQRTLPGLRYLLTALAAFAVAMFISLRKARRARRGDHPKDHSTAGKGTADASFGAQLRRVRQSVDVMLLTLYRALSVAGVVLVVASYLTYDARWVYSSRNVMRFVSDSCATLGLLATLAALGLALCIGAFELVFVVRPQRSLRWYLVANALVLLVGTVFIPAVH